MIIKLVMLNFKLNSLFSSKETIVYQQYLLVWTEVAIRDLGLTDTRECMIFTGSK